MAAANLEQCSHYRHNQNFGINYQEHHQHQQNQQQHFFHYQPLGETSEMIGNQRVGVDSLEVKSFSQVRMRSGSKDLDQYQRYRLANWPPIHLETANHQPPIGDSPSKQSSSESSSSTTTTSFSLSSPSTSINSSSIRGSCTNQLIGGNASVAQQQPGDVPNLEGPQQFFGTCGKLEQQQQQQQLQFINCNLSSGVSACESSPLVMISLSLFL